MNFENEVDETNYKLTTIIDSLVFTIELQKIELNGLRARLDEKSKIIEALDERLADMKKPGPFVVDVPPADKPKRKYTRRKNATKRGPGRPRKNVI